MSKTTVTAITTAVLVGQSLNLMKIVEVLRADYILALNRLGSDSENALKLCDAIEKLDKIKNSIRKNAKLSTRLLKITHQETFNKLT